MTDIDKRVRQTIADVLGLAGEDISPSSSRLNTPEWDSLKHIEIIMAIESEFDVRFTVEEIEAFRTCGDIVATMRAKT